VIVFIVMVDIAKHVAEILAASHVGKTQARRHVVDDVDMLTAQLGRSLGSEVDQIGGYVVRETGYGAVKL